MWKSMLTFNICFFIVQSPSSLLVSGCSNNSGFVSLPLLVLGGDWKFFLLCICLTQNTILLQSSSSSIFVFLFLFDVSVALQLNNDYNFLEQTFAAADDSAII